VEEQPKPKTDEEWLAETADSPHLTKIKLSIIGQIALEKLHGIPPVDKAA
jgi:hypothetical protein